jgi:CDP-diacylglycerol--glycerol-3-phosphate 3-phosphatidyltransferase
MASTPHERHVPTAPLPGHGLGPRTVADTLAIMTVPQALSAFRLLSAPVLLFLAYAGRPGLFLALLVAALLSDAVDGWIARRLRQTSELGMQLDSWGDLALCGCVPLGIWWLWPDVVRREAVFVAMILASYAVPTLAALIRYRRLPSYHTYLAKFAACIMGPSALILLLGGSALPFHVAVLVAVIEALEETAITAVLPTWTGNVTGIRHALAIRRDQQPIGSGLRPSAFPDAKRPDHAPTNT